MSGKHMGLKERFVLIMMSIIKFASCLGLVGCLEEIDYIYIYIYIYIYYYIYKPT